MSEQPNICAWLHVLGDMPRAGSQYAPAENLISRCARRLSITASIERWLGGVQKTDLKSRTRKLGEAVFESCVRLQIQDVRGIRARGESFDPEALLLKPKQGKAVAGNAIAWLATSRL